MLEGYAGPFILKHARRFITAESLAGLKISVWGTGGTICMMPANAYTY